MNDIWDMLHEPFPPEELQWRVEALSKDKRRALVAPYVSHKAVLDRLDEVVGVQGWQDSYEVLQTPAQPAGLYAVKCRLTIMDICKEDVGEGDSLKAAFAEALVRAAVKFGVGRFLIQLEQQWVEHDPVSGKFTPPVLGMAEGYIEPATETKPLQRSASSPIPSEVKPEPQELIDRLIERLKHAGLGKQAALIVMKYGGYGKHPEETRKLYGELRALLKGQAS
ncbi:Rad52/Rad22 family DNA repair protein [Meiothermus cerbereus]|uniref:Rad52/Rad22 family DNA repair protein n=1 Tax=Meiothermus cerbereus TaxID=65552 RepID=UPI003EEE908C